MELLTNGTDVNLNNLSQDSEAKLNWKLKRTKQNINKLRVAMNTFLPNDENLDDYQKKIDKERSEYMAIMNRLAKLTGKRKRTLLEEVKNNNIATNSQIMDDRKKANMKLKTKTVFQKFFAQSMGTNSGIIDVIIY